MYVPASTITGRQFLQLTFNRDYQILSQLIYSALIAAFTAINKQPHIKLIMESMWTCVSKGRHEGTRYDRHTAAADQAAQSPSAHRKLLPQHYAASDTAQSDRPFQAACHGALLRQPGLTALAAAHQAPATPPSPQLINACQHQQQAVSISQI